MSVALPPVGSSVSGAGAQDSFGIDESKPRIPDGVDPFFYAQSKFDSQ